MKLKIYNDSLSSLINPKIIKLKPNLYGMLFYIMKIAPAYYIINKALKEKRINSNQYQYSLQRIIHTESSYWQGVLV